MEQASRVTHCFLLLLSERLVRGYLGQLLLRDTNSQLPEVLCSLWYRVIVELEYDASGRCQWLSNCNVKLA